jgi:hypothetical protein
MAKRLLSIVAAFFASAVVATELATTSQAARVDAPEG